MKTWMMSAVAVAAGASMMLLNGCGTGVGTGPIPTAFTKAFAVGYNEETGASSIVGYSIGPGGATQILNLTGPSRTEDDSDSTSSATYIDGLASDANGNVYALIDSEFYQESPHISTETCTIAKFSGNAGTGTFTASPSAATSFTSSSLCTGGDDGIEPDYLGVDAAGNFYVVGYDGTLKFAANSIGMSGDVAPTVNLQDQYAYTDDGSAFVDAAGNLYTQPYDYENNTEAVAVYAAGFGSDSTPRFFSPNHGVEINGMWADTSGKVYLTESDYDTNINQVDVFSPTATGVSAAVQSIVGASTTFLDLQGIATDSNGTIYVQDVSNLNEPAVVHNRHAAVSRRQGVRAVPAESIQNFMVIKEFSANANGNVAPTAALTTQATDAYYFSVR